MKTERKVSKEKILDKAIKLIAKKGIDNVSMREIAENLNVSKPVLYYYFKNKNDIVKEAFKKETKELENLNLKDFTGKEVQDLIYEIIHMQNKIFSDDFNKAKCVLKIFDSEENNDLKEQALKLREKNRKDIKEVLEIMNKKNKINKEAINLTVHFISALLSYQILETSINKKSIDLNILKNLSKIIALGLKNFKMIGFILMFFSIPLFSETLNINQAVDIAMEKNISILNSIENKKIYEEKINEYYGGVYPSLNMNTSYTRNIEKQSLFFNGNKILIGLDNAYALSLDVNQILWAGGKVGTGIKIAKIYSKISDENLLYTENTIKKNVKQLFYSILLFKEMMKIQEETSNLAKKHLETIKEQYNQGLQSDLNVMRQEVQYSNSLPNLIQAENTYKQGLLNLKDLLGLEVDKDIDLEGDLNIELKILNDYENLYAKAITNRQDYKLSLLNLDFAKKQVSLEKAGHWPTLSGFISKAFSGQSNSSFPNSNERSWSLNAGVKLNMPIFSGFSVTSRVKESEHSLKIAEQNLENIKRKIKISLKKVLSDIEESKKRVDSQKTSVETAKKALKNLEIRFANGLSSQLELNDYTLSLNQAETLYVKAKYDLCYNIVQLQWELGE